MAADSVVELEFGIREGSAVYSLANALDVDATLERLSQTPGGDLVAYATFSDCTQEDIEAVLDDVPAIAGGAFVCHQDESALFRLDLEEGCVETALVGRGGVVTGLTVEDGLREWGRLAARNRDRASEDWVMPGVRRGRYDPADWEDDA
mgnify:CR=1 FL=1